MEKKVTSKETALTTAAVVEVVEVAVVAADFPAHALRLEATVGTTGDEMVVVDTAAVEDTRLLAPIDALHEGRATEEVRLRSTSAEEEAFRHVAEDRTLPADDDDD